MSFHAVTAALKIKGLSPAEKFLLVVMASYANTDKHLVAARRLALSDDTGITDRNIRRLLLSLQAKNIIHRQARRKGGQRASDFITLYLPDLMSAGQPKTDPLPDMTSATSGQIVQNLPDVMSDKPVREPIKEPVSAREALAGQAPASRAFAEPRLQRLRVRQTPTETPAEMAARLRRLA